MRAIRRFMARLASVAGSRRSRQDHRMEQEFREHIELQTSDYIRAGIPPEEARRRAICKFGPVEALKEEFRDQLGMPALERLLKDLRHAFRTLAHEPGFAILTTLMLGIGLAGAIVMFSLIDGILLKPLPYRDPERLTTVREVVFSSPMEVNAYHFIAWRKHCPSIESMALIEGLAANITGLGEPERIKGAAVSSNFFRMLGVNSALGRGFVDEEEQAAKSSVAVLTDGIWRRKLNADPHVIGRAISMNGHSYTIVGVLGPKFRFPDSNKPELFIPKVFSGNDLVKRLGHHNYDVIARLKPGVTRRQTVIELQAVQQRIEREEGADWKLGAAVDPLIDAISGKARATLLLLMGAVGILALIICVNLANLLLARGERRLHEFGIRAALGAGRVRLATHALAEVVILATAGGALAFGLASAVVTILSRANDLNIPRLDEASPDGRAVLFTAALVALTALIFGLLPVWRAGRSDPQSALRAGSRNIADSLAGRRTRSALVACEVGLCVPLLVMAGLLTNSFVRLVAADKGFSAPMVMAVDIKPAGDKYTDESERRSFYQNLFSNLESAPGVSAAAVTSWLPLQGSGGGNLVSPTAGAPPMAMTPAGFRFISSDYFRVMGIPLYAGRAFSAHDRDRRSVIISARLGRILWPRLDPMGRKFTVGADKWFTVIGVVGDVRANPEEPPATIVYRPYWDDVPYSTTLVAQAEGDPRSIQGALRSAIRKTDPDIPVPRMRTMAQVLDERVVTRKFEMFLAGAFALIALVVANLGVYAVISCSVARRTSEIGLRAALGAQTSSTYRLVLRQGLAPVAAGLLIGIPCALAGARALSSSLYEVRPNDATTLIAAVLILLAVAAAACLIPARRAARIDPVISLKYE